MQSPARQTPKLAGALFGIVLVGVAVPVPAQSFRVREPEAAPAYPRSHEADSPAAAWPANGFENAPPQRQAARQTESETATSAWSSEGRPQRLRAVEQSAGKLSPSRALATEPEILESSRPEPTPAAKRIGRGDAATNRRPTKLSAPRDTNDSPIRLTGWDADAGQEPAARYAAGPLTYREPAAPAPVDLGGLALRLVIGTATVLGACVVSLWLARRWLPHGQPAKKGQGRMKILDTLAVAPRGCVQLIEIEHRLVLIASDAGGIKSVTPLPQQFAENLESCTAQSAAEETTAPAVAA